MSVYEAVRVCKEKSGNLYQKINITTALRHICCFGLSVLFSLSGFNESFSPFGVAFVGCVSARYTLTSAVGSAIGYFVALDSVSALRYTSSVLALAVIITALKAFKEIRKNVLTPVVVSFVCIFVTGMAVVFSNGFTLFSFLICFCEAAVGGACAFVFSKSRVYLTVTGCLKAITSKEITAVVISGAILLLSFRYAVVFGVSLAHIIAIFLILMCAYYGKEAGGAIVGICCGVTMSYGTNDLFLLSFYSFGGLLCGAVSGFGRIACVTAFSLAGILIGVISGEWGQWVPVAVEVVVASIAFGAVSLRFNYELKDFFYPPVSAPIIESVKANVINRLHKASEFSSEICETLDSVNNALSKSEKSDISLIPKKVKSSVCGSCGLYDSCWNEQRQHTEESFENLLLLKTRGEYLEYKTVPQRFSSSCIRSEAVASAYNKLFSECKLNEKTENRIREIQSLASEQFINVSSLLSSLCRELDEEVYYDMDIASRSRAAAAGLGLHVVDSCCTSDSNDRLVIEMRLKRPSDIKSINNLTPQLEIVCARGLQAPVIDEFEDYIKAVFCEKPKYKAVSSVVQYCAGGEKYSGDTYATFNDDKGWFYAVICDGMGTGAKAAVSSGLAVALLEKLLKAGFGIEAAVNTVNTSLISKSGDECSVTLDLLAFDLYTGRAELYKCGAQSSVVKRKGKISDVSCASLPLGILSEIDIAQSVSSLGMGDVALICSDGVREEDLWQIRNALKVFESGDVATFTRELAETVRRSQPQKNDDFTMLILAVTGNK